MIRRMLILASLLVIGCADPVERRPGVAARDGDVEARIGAVKPATVRPFALPRVDAVLLITGGTHGRLEVCNCPGPMNGGLSRRSGLAASYRAAHPNVIFIDAGDAFNLRPTDVKNRYVLRGYKAAGYDALVLGANEWSALSSQLPALMAESPMPFLSTNATPVKVKLPLTRELLRKIGKTKIAVLSCLGAGSLYYAAVEVPGQLKIDPIAVVARRAAALKARGYVVIVVAHMTEGETEAFKDVKNVDLLIRGHTAQAEEKPMTVGAIPMLKVGGREVVGAAALQIEGGRISGMDYRLEVVDDHWPRDQYVMGIYQAYAHEAMREALDAKRIDGLKYVSSATCGKCHPKQYQAWRKGPHREVWDKLARVKRTGDPNCVMCHSSGFGTKDGFRTHKTTPHLAGVNCQSCHRVNMHEGRCQMPVPKITKDTCELCHTPVNSPMFDYKIYRRHLGCTQTRAGK